MEREDAVTTLGYESRQDTRQRRTMLTAKRLHAPIPALVAVAWVGTMMILWGSAALVGGYVIVVIGICLATTGVVPILFWELLIRPVLRHRHVEAPRVRGRTAVVMLYLAGCIFYIVGGLPEAVGFVTRPIWVPVADYYYAKRPALAPEPRVLFLGPFILTNVDIHPHGIHGDIPGGGRVQVRYDETVTPAVYRFEAESLTAFEPRY